MKLLNSLFIKVVFYFFVAIHAAYAASDYTIAYKNQRGSIMSLNFHPGKEANEGILDGTVRLATNNRKKGVDQLFPLYGYYSGNAMAITVHFSSSQQVTAMVGHFLDDKNTIQTLSLDALQTKNSHIEDWNANIIRAGSYTRFSSKHDS